MLKSKMFTEYSIAEIFTEKIFEAMKKEESIIQFMENKIVLNVDEYSKWITENGILASDKRIIYGLKEEKGIKFYKIYYTNDIISTYIDLRDIKGKENYSDFIKYLEKTMEYRNI